MPILNTCICLHIHNSHTAIPHLDVRLCLPNFVFSIIVRELSHIEKHITFLSFSFYFRIMLLHPLKYNYLGRLYSFLDIKGKESYKIFYFYRKSIGSDSAENRQQT